MVVSAEQARQKAEARRQRILAKSAERLDMASNGMASKEVEHSVPLSPVRRRRNQNKKKKTVEKLRLTLHATKLKNVAGLGKGISDPYANVTLVTSGRELILGQTEVVKNSIHPTWTSSFLLDYNKGEKMSIEVSVVDEVTKGSHIPMGCKLSSICMQCRQRYIFLLLPFDSRFFTLSSLNYSRCIRNWRYSW